MIINLPYSTICNKNIDFNKEIIVDGFAGGGGASTGIELALGVSPDIAINHDIEAIALHAANHPNTEHYISDIFEVDPYIATMGRPVGLFWLSPDCKHHSKAKGGKPRDNKIRSLAWVAVKWAKQVRPRVIMLENVEEFKDWCPLDNCGYPLKEKKGETFKLFCTELEALGYKVEYQEIKACDFGAPTTRKRLFLIARCDGRDIVFPKPTHANAQSQEVKEGKLLPYKTAADIIDWSIPTYSIFMDNDEAKQYKVRRPLSDKTMERIIKGFEKFVINTDNPYIIDDKLLPFISTYYGKTKHSTTRGQKVDTPLATITAGGLRHGLAVPYVMAIDNLSNNNSTWSIDAPLTTITSKARHCIVTPYIAKHYTGATGFKVDEPMHTITTQDHHSVITAFLHKFYGQECRQKVTEPLHTIRTVGHFGLVEIKGIQYKVMDIGFRMLSPRELYNAQGFPSDYKIDITMPNGKTLPKTAQVRMCGNSVSPVIPKALIEANFSIETREEKVA